MKRLLIGCIFIVWAGMVLSQTKNQRDADGRKQGYWEAVDRNGKLVYSGYFKDDRPVGEMKRYFPTGGVRVIMNYDDTGTKARARFFGQNGELAADGNYINTQRDSVWLYYNKYAKTLSHRVEYTAGKQNGKAQSFYPDGNIAEEIIWKDGIKDGACKQYFNSGQLKSTGIYISDKLEGAFASFYPSGKQEIEGAYRHGAPDGEWKRYDENGKLTSTIKYAGGKITNLEEMEAAQREFFKKVAEQEGRIQEPTIEDLMRETPQQ